MAKTLNNQLKEWAEQYETAEIFPDDPTKGDFALFGYGVNNGKVAPVTTEPEPEKEQPTAVADLSIADVLKMRLFSTMPPPKFGIYLKSEKKPVKS